MLSRVRWLRPAGIVLLLAGLCGVPLHGLAEAPASLAERIMEAGLADDSAKLDDLKVQAADVPKPKSPGNRKSARKLNSDGVAALLAGDLSSAVSLLKQAAEADATDVEVVNNLGYAMVRAGNYGDAKQVLSHALQLVPGRSAAWMNLGEAYGGAGDKAKAAACFRIALAFSAAPEKAVAYLKKLSEAPTSETTAAAARQITSMSIPSSATDGAASTASSIEATGSQVSTEPPHEATSATPVVAVGIPAFKGPVNDLSGALTDVQSSDLSKRIHDINAHIGNQVAILLLPSVGSRDLQEYAQEVAKTWALDHRDIQNGVVLVATTENKEARLTVGRSLADVITQADLTRFMGGFKTWKDGGEIYNALSAFLTDYAAKVQQLVAAGKFPGATSPHIRTAPPTPTGTAIAKQEPTKSGSEDAATATTTEKWALLAGGGIPHTSAVTLIVLVAVLWFLVGLAKPALALKWDAAPTRTKVAGYFFGMMIVLKVATAATGGSVISTGAAAATAGPSSETLQFCIHQTKTLYGYRDPQCAYGMIDTCVTYIDDPEALERKAYAMSKVDKGLGMLRGTYCPNMPNTYREAWNRY